MKKKIFVLTVAILVLAFSLLSLSACTTINDLKDDVAAIVKDYVVIDDAGNELEFGKTYDMPRSLKFFAASPNSNKTVRLTATITPAAAADKSVDWSVAWVNPSSTWATGKTVTDYVTVTPTSDGALTADVHFVANFGEPIDIVVISREVSSVTASCRVDCYCDVSPVPFSFHNSSGSPILIRENSTLDLPSISFFYSTNLSSVNSSGYSLFSYSAVSTPFTVPLSLTSSRIYVKRSDSLESALASSFAGYNQSVAGTSAVMSFGSPMSWTEITPSSYAGGNQLSIVDFYHVLFSGSLTRSDQDLTSRYFYNNTVSALQATSGAHFYIKFELTFDGIGTVIEEFPVTFSSSSIGLVAASVSLNQNSITF